MMLMKLIVTLGKILQMLIFLKAEYKILYTTIFYKEKMCAHFGSTYTRKNAWK